MKKKDAIEAAEESSFSGSGTSATSYAWSDSLDSGFWRSNYALLQRTSFAVNDIQRNKWFNMVVFVLELAMLVLVPIDAVIRRSAPSLNAQGTAEALHYDIGSTGDQYDSRGASVAEAARYCFDPAAATIETEMAVVWIALIYCVVVGLGFLWLLWTMSRGNPASRKLLWCLNHCSVILVRVLCLPFAYGIVRNISQHTALGMSVGIVAAIVYLPLTLYSSFFHFDVIPSSGFMAQLNGRSLFLTTAMRLALAGMYPVEQSLDTVRVCVMLVMFVALLVYNWVFLPYYRNRCNYATVGIWATCTWTSVCAVAASAVVRSGNSPSIAPFVVAFAGALFAGAAGWVSMILRMRIYRKAFHAAIGNLASPRQVNYMLRICFNVRPVTEEINEKALQILAAAKEKFTESSALHLLHGIILLEYKQDPRGMIAHGKSAKRLNHIPDTQFVINSFIQHAQDVIQGDASKRGVETMLETAVRHTRLAKAYAAKFWQSLLRARGESSDIVSMFDLVVALDYHDHKAKSVLLTLVGRYPTNFKILREYARFLDELQCDKESAAQAFLLADQYEEEAASRFAKSHNERHVRVAPEDDVELGGVSEQPAQQQTGATQPKQVGIELSEMQSAPSETSTIATSASAAIASDTAHSRSVRSRIERAKSPTVNRMHFVIILTLAVLFCFLILQYALGLSSLSSFAENLSVVNSTIGCKQDLFASVFYLRMFELSLMNIAAGGNGSVVGSNGATNVRELVLSRAREFESLFDSMFKQSGLTTEIDKFWGAASIPMKLYVQGPNTTFSAGTFTQRKMPLWDAGYTVLNYIRETTKITSLSSLGTTDLRSVTSFRAPLDNAPIGIAAALDTVADMHANLLVSSADNLNTVIYVLFPLTVACAFVMVIILFFLFGRKINHERQAAVKLFSSIPRSTLINTYDKLSSGREKDMIHDTVTIKKGMSSVRKLEIAVVLVCLSFLALSASIFGVFLSFTSKNSNAGITIASAGNRRNLLGSTRFWSQELAVMDPTTYPYNFTKDYLINTVLAQFDFLDSQLKYGNSTAGLESYITTDSSVFNLWYDRPCPTEYKLKQCTGFAILMKNYIDSVRRFAHSPKNVVGLTNSEYQFALMVQQGTVQWSLEGINLMYENVLKQKNSTSNNVTLCFFLGLPLLFVAYVFLVYFIRRLSTELERLVKMLLFVPVNVLDTVTSVKEFLETGDITASSSDATEAQEQQTKHILDGCEDAVLVIGTNRLVEMCNPAAERLSHFTAGELMGVDVNMVIPPELGSNANFLKRITIDTSSSKDNTKLTIQQEIKFRTKEGPTIDALVSVSQSSARGKTIFGLFIRDITPLKQREEAITHEKQRAEAMLLNILPRALVKQMAVQSKGKNQIIAQAYDEVTILFANICGFSQLTRNMDAEGVVLTLNSLVCQWDKMALSFGGAIEKIKTIGDIYMCCAGAPVSFAENAEAMIEFGICILEGLKEFNKTQKQPINIRIGINTGRVVGGVIGLHKFVFDLWGDSVNVASRMQSSGVADRIQVSEATYQKLKGKGYTFENRGKILIKGKGEMDCYLLDPSCCENEVDALNRRDQLKAKLVQYFDNPGLPEGQPQQQQAPTQQQTTATHTAITAAQAMTSPTLVHKESDLLGGLPTV